VGLGLSLVPRPRAGVYSELKSGEPALHSPGLHTGSRTRRHGDCGAFRVLTSPHAAIAVIVRTIARKAPSDSQSFESGGQPVRSTIGPFLNEPETIRESDNRQLEADADPRSTPCTTALPSLASGRLAPARHLVQRVLLQIVKGLASLRDVERLHAWVYRTARNVIVDYYRSPTTRREVASGDAEDLAARGESHLPHAAEREVRLPDREPFSR
jgi:Sigma-70 region 2